MASQQDSRDLKGPVPEPAPISRTRTALPPLRQTLLYSLGVLFIVTVVLASVALVIFSPRLTNPQGAFLFALVLLALSLVVLVGFGGLLLRRTLVAPLDELVGDAQRIAGGEYRHRIGPANTAELQALSDAVNAMAARLIHDQELLAENVRSLESTNRELLAASQQLVRSARLASVGTLASGIAHEVGNPLSAIIGFVDLARSRMERGDPDPELLEAVSNEAQRIDRIVRSLLNYARPRDEVAQPFSPKAVVARVRDLLETQGRFDRVQVSWESEGEIPPVLMDPHRLEQVLVNLLLNALDALEGQPDPRIEVRVSFQEGESIRRPARREDDPPGINYSHRRRLRGVGSNLMVDALELADRVVTITVRDNGPGIDEDHLEQLFDPFFTTKEPGKGTGLGLAVCAQLIEGMGGRIDGGNHPDGGARFIVQLPSVLDDPSIDLQDTEMGAELGGEASLGDIGGLKQPARARVPHTNDS